jgi:hypothetical protein
MAYRIVNKAGVSDTRAEIVATVQAEETVVYCIDTQETVYFSGGIWVDFTNEKVYSKTPVPANTIVTDANNRFCSDADISEWDAKQNALVSATNIKTINGSSVLGSGDLTVSGVAAWGSVTGTLSAQTDLQTALNGKEPLKGSDDNYVTDAEKIVIGNTSGTNTGDNATNSQYSGLAASKQDTLVSATNIKTINGSTILGSGDLTVTGGLTQQQIEGLI